MEDIHLGTLFGLLILSILCSAFFSASETALMTLNRYRLRHLASTGHRGALRAQALLRRPDRLIGMILLGNNFVNVMASSIGTIIALKLGGEGLIPIAAGLLTLIVLIYGEVGPKTLAALRPEPVAFFAAFIYTPLLYLLYPLVWLVNLVANAHLKLLGVSPEESMEQALSHEELRTVLIEAEALIPKRHHQMLLSILDLGDAKVEEIMIPRNDIEGIDLEGDIDEIIRTLANSFYTRFPLYEGSIDQVVGVVHIRRAMHALSQDTLTVEKLRELAEEPYFIPEGTPLNRQLLNFQREHRHIGLVVDEYGDIQGLLTLADLLEEIVGEFTTDPADGIPEVQPQPDGSFLVAGNAQVRDLVRTFHWKLPTDGPRTMNGLILEYLEDIPEPGTSLLLEGYPVEILQTQDNAVKTLRFHPQQRKENG